MKKILIIFVLLLTVSFAFGQRRGQTIKWFSLGLKASVGNSFLLNTDVLEDSKIQPDYFTPAFSYGGRLTFSHGENIGIGIEYLNSSFGQDYGVATDSLAYTKSIDIKTSDITLFFRYSGQKGGYFEIGPRFSTLKSVTEENDIQANFRNTDNLIDYYGPKFTSIVIGTGLSLVRTERVNVNAGVRATYSFSDLNPNKTYYVLDDYVYRPDYIPTATTNPITLKFVLEVNYFFAFWGDASCGRGRLMFFQ